MRRSGFVSGCLASALLWLATSGCAQVLRYPQQVIPPDWSQEEDLLETLNPTLLSGLLATRVVFEVDWVEGHRPAQMTVEQFEAIATQYLPPETEVEVFIDDEIPWKGWESIKASGEINQMAALYLDRVPDPDEGLEVVYLVFVPHSLEEIGLYGHAHGWIVQRGGITIWVDGVSIYTDPITEKSKLWVNDERIERTTLIHEFGHVLGLVHNPEHTQQGNLGHCTNPDCVMTHPRWRSLLYWGTAGGLGARMPRDYCRECQADITWAKERWAASAREDPSYARSLAAGETARRAVQLGQWLWLRNAADQALETIQRALEEVPGSPELHEFHGDLLRGRRDFAGALIAYQQALALKPGPGPRAGIALVQCRLGNYAEGYAALDPASLKTPTDVTTVRVATWALVGLSRLGEASDLWDHHVKLAYGGSSSQLAAQHQVRLRRLAGQPKAAERLLRTSFKKWPWDRALLEQAARLDLAAGRTGVARARLRAMVESLDELEQTQTEGLSDWILTTRLIYLALAGENERAEREIESLDWRELVGESGGVPALRKASAMALLGDEAGALEALEIVAGQRMPLSYEWDVCLVEDLEPLRGGERFLEIFPHCDQAVGGAR